MDTEKLKEDLKISRYDLEREASEQASLYFYYAEMQADAKAEANSAKDALSLITAEQSLFYRKNPPEGLKVTEAVVVSLVEQDREVIDAKERLVNAYRELTLLDGILRALDHKKSSVDNLVKLYLNNYYSASSEVGETRTDKDQQMTTETTKKLTSKMKERKNG